MTPWGTLGQLGAPVAEGPGERSNRDHRDRSSRDKQILPAWLRISLDLPGGLPVPQRGCFEAALTFR